jgi:AAA+ superfamily predicted ATPase
LNAFEFLYSVVCVPQNSFRIKSETNFWEETKYENSDKDINNVSQQLFVKGNQNAKKIFCIPFMSFQENEERWHPPQCERNQSNQTNE